MSEDNRVVLELPACVMNAERLGSSVDTALPWVSFIEAPNEFGDDVHVLVGEGGPICIRKELFDRCGTGLRWDKLHLLDRRGFYIKDYHEFSIVAQPPDGETGDVDYTKPGSRAVPRKDLRPEWAIRQGLPPNPPR